MSKWPYNTQRWQRLRRQKLRQNPLCEDCLKRQLVIPAVAVDHFWPIRAGGDAYPPLNQLTSLCIRVTTTKHGASNWAGDSLSGVSRLRCERHANSNCPRCWEDPQ